MSTSLAAQLAQRRTLDSSRLASVASLKHPPSLIFTPAQSARISTQSLADLASSSWDALANLDPFFENAKMQNLILGPEARRTDRAGLTKEENEKVSKSVERVLRALSRWAGLRDAGVVVEWLIRRFRVNDLNATALISLFLPYHLTPHFPTLLSLVQPSTLQQTPYAPLTSFRSSILPISLTSLVAQLSSSSAYLQAVLDLPKKFLEEGESAPRVVSSFWLQIVAEFLDKQGKALKEEEKGIVLGSILEVLRLASVARNQEEKKEEEDIIMASFILLCRFALNYPMEGDRLRVVMKSVAAAGAGKKEGDVSEGGEDTERAMLTTLVVLAGLCPPGGEDVVSGEKLWLGKTGWKGVIRVRDLGPLLVELCNQYNAENFMNPFLTTLVTEAETEPAATTLLNSLLIPYPSPSSDTLLLLPNNIISIILASTLAHLLSTEDLAQSPFLKPLSLIHQRWPTLWESSTQSLISPTSSEKLWQIISLVLSNGTTSKLIDSATPDPSVRLFALKELLSQASELKSSQSGLELLRSSLEGRLIEGGEDILNVLLGSEVGRKTVEEVVGEERIGEILFASESEGSRVKYLTESYLDKYEGKTPEVVRKVIWGRLLKSKHGDVDPVWWSGKAGKNVWLKGVESANDNATVAKTIASNIVGLEGAEELKIAIDFLLEKVGQKSGGGKGRALAFLVMIDLVRLINPRLRVSLVGRLFDVLGTSTTSALDNLASPSGELLTPDSEPSTYLLDRVFAHPIQDKTTQRLQSAVLVAATSSLHSSSAAWEWLAPPSSSDNQSFTLLVKRIYFLSHTGTTTSGRALGSELLSALLGDGRAVGVDALAFFASIWSDSETPEGVKKVALEEAGVFVEVQGAGGRDWQVVVPAVVGALRDQSKVVREEAIKLVQKLRDEAGKGGKDVYGRQKFYGAATSKEVKFLDVTDVVAYLDKLLASKTELTMDPAFLSTLHSNLLDDNSLASSSSSPKKKKSSLLHKVVLFLLSHVSAWQSITGRSRLLTALENVKDGLKSEVVLAVLGTVVRGANEYANEQEKDVKEYVRLLFGVFGSGVSRKWLEGQDKPMETFVLALELAETSGPAAFLRREALRVTQTSLFSSLRSEQRLDLFKRLVRLSAGTESPAASEVHACLRACKPDAETITAFLSEIRLSIASPVSKSSKRSRTSLGSASSRAERIPELIVVLETFDFATVPPSHALVLGTFDLLSSIIEVSTSAQVDIQYPGQLLLSTLSKLVANAQPDSGVTSDSIRMNPVLDFMRASTNPQTSHQALMLLSQLGPLVPDQLVNNVMQIFTFMGANVFQRDDAYSLRVVDQALDNILPALVKSMKKTTTGRDGLVSDLGALLRVFTDAASHIPRHRRVKLYIRLVETLGAREFLSAVTTLLLESNISSNDPLALPLSVLEAFGVEAQLLAFQQIIEEALGHLIGSGEEADAPEALTPAAADPSDKVLNTVNLLTAALDSKQFSAKVDAARAAGKDEVDTAFSELVRALLDLAKTSSDSTFDDTEEINAAAGEGVQAAVRLMSIESFSEAILWLLDGSDPAVQAGALELLRTRLPVIKPAKRGEVSPAVVTVVDRIRVALADTTAAHDELLDTLHAIVSFPYADEDLALSKTVPELLALVASPATSKDARLTSLEIVRTLSSRLGPRLIPLAGKLIPFCLSLLRGEAKHAAGSASIVASAFRILEGLFTSIPTFIGTQLDQVLETVLSKDILRVTEQDVTSAKARASLLSASAKRLPAKTLYPSIIRLHSTLDLSEKTPTLGLMDVLNRALRHGKAADVADNYRSIFKLFLTVFDTRRTPPPALSVEDVVDVEENTLGAFVQFILKLSEQTFRPVFLRTFDWAVVDLAEEGDQEAVNARRTVLYKVVDRLLVQLKSIVVPYFSFMLDQTIEVLDSSAKGVTQDLSLWSAMAGALTKAIDYDETGFWTSARLNKLSKAIAAQVESPNPLPSFIISNEFHPLLSTYAQAIGSHEKVLKAFNTALLMSTRSDDLRVKRSAIEAIEQVWEAVGDGMLGLVPETTPFLSETLEESSGGVEVATRRLITRIEAHLGESLADYLA